MVIVEHVFLSDLIFSNLFPYLLGGGQGGRRGGGDDGIVALRWKFSHKSAISDTKILIFLES